MVSTGGSPETSGVAAADALPPDPYAAKRKSGVMTVGDTSLIEAFRVLFDAVLEALKMASIGCIFQGLESTLRHLEPFIKEKDSLGVPKEKVEELTELMVRGDALVRRCVKSHVIQWNTHHYVKKLRKLQNDILRLLLVYVPLRICRDSKELQLEVKDLDLEIRRLDNLTQEKVRGNVRRCGGLESCEVPKELNFMVGRDDSFHELKGELLKEGVSVLVVSAPGGFGKTALAMKLGHDSDIKGKFKNIFFIKVSKSTNFIAMVHKIIQSQRSGLDVPIIETEDDAVYQFQQLLTQIGDIPVLLILDDVPSESASLVEKFVFNRIPNYKILVTSRFEFPRFGAGHRLSCLNHEDAEELFLHSAIPQFGNPPEPNEELTEKIVELCEGSPLALTQVGRSLCGKHPSIWRSKLLEWSEDPSLLDSSSEILGHLGRA